MRVNNELEKIWKEAVLHQVGVGSANLLDWARRASRYSVAQTSLEQSHKLQGFPNLLVLIVLVYCRGQLDCAYPYSLML
jgi:hypothetical protein